MKPEYYILQRNRDISGNSGTGQVAEVLAVPGKIAVLFWTPDHNALHISSVVIYQNVTELIQVHGHEGATVLVPAALTEEKYNQLCVLIDENIQNLYSVLDFI